MKIVYRGKLYESVVDQQTERKILSTIKNAKKYNNNKENELYRVGGIVRDNILGIESKDIDYLVTNVAFSDLKKALVPISDKIISTDVGDSMQVIKAYIDGSQEPYDFAIPRTEKYGGSGGHTDVIATGNPGIPVEDELGRRDLTINAIAYNVETHQLIDPYGGIPDIHNKILKAVGDPVQRFGEDPLRILRVLQFANRFGFTIDPKTMEAIKANVHLLDSTTGERIMGEFDKAFTKGNSKGNKLFAEILEDSGIGKHVFGDDFDPIAVNIIYGDKLIVNLILLFLNGGNFERMKPSTEVKTAITLARALVTGDALKVMYRNGRYLQVLKDAFRSIADPILVDKLNKLEGVPLEAKDLAISSDYLMNKGYEGPKLGSIQKTLIDEIYHKHIKNDETSIKNYLDSVR
jgi:hypothetical protein